METLTKEMIKLQDIKETRKVTLILIVFMAEEKEVTLEMVKAGGLMVGTLLEDKK